MVKLVTFKFYTNVEVNLEDRSYLGDVIPATRVNNQILKIHDQTFRVVHPGKK